jgi:hypothetical protein
MRPFLSLLTTTLLTGSIWLLPLAQAGEHTTAYEKPCPFGFNKTARLTQHTGQLPEEHFDGQILNGVRFKRYNLAGAHFRGTQLFTASFQGSNLAGADFRHATLMGTDLRRANLQGANFSGADLRDTRLSGADFTGAIYDRNTQFPYTFAPQKHGLIPAKADALFGIE